MSERKHTPGPLDASAHRNMQMLAVAFLTARGEIHWDEARGWGWLAVLPDGTAARIPAFDLPRPDMPACYRCSGWSLEQCAAAAEALGLTYTEESRHRQSRGDTSCQRLTPTS